MKELLELDQWDNNGVLKYSYTSIDMEYLEDKADRIYKVINAINKVEKRYDVYLTYEASDLSPEVTLHIEIQSYDEHKCKKNKGRQKRDL